MKVCLGFQGSSSHRFDGQPIRIIDAKRTPYQFADRARYRHEQARARFTDSLGCSPRYHVPWPIVLFWDAASRWLRRLTTLRPLPTSGSTPRLSVRLTFRIKGPFAFDDNDRVVIRNVPLAKVRVMRSLNLYDVTCLVSGAG